MKFYSRHTSGFTLIEMMIATAIFGIMSAIILSVYIQTTEVSRQLQMTRLLNESAREITERIATDIRENGIDMTNLTIPTSPHMPWNSHAYTSSGGEILAINGGKQYIYGKKTSVGMDQCIEADKEDRQMHCSLYIVQSGDFINAYNTLDSFVPDDREKRVKIRDLKFFVSGDEITEKKATLLFTLELMPRVGIGENLAGRSALRIQTTISERGFRNYTP